MKEFSTNKTSVHKRTNMVEVGAVQSVTNHHQGIDLVTENAFVRLTVYSPHVVRVRVSRQKPIDDFSYAVVAAPSPTKVVVTEDKQQILLCTSALKIRIYKQSYAVGFYTSDDLLINQDEPGLPNSWVESTVTSYKSLQEGERFIGLGEKHGGLDRRGHAYTNWNSDAFAYRTDQDPLYTSFPFYIGIHHGLNYGIFLDNTYQTDFNFGASTNRFSSFAARGGDLDYYFIYHPRMADIITSYTALTGRMQLPPLWSLGYQQNRYSYYPATEVLRIAQTLREKKIPADGITLDIHYMDAYKLFTWDKSRFPNPRQLTDELRAMGFKTTIIVDPGIKVEEGYGAYERGLEADIFVKYPDESNYTGQVWPGWCHFPDFTAPQGREWWMNELISQVDDGIDGVWNDMNEIATWGQKMPDNLLFDYDGRMASHLKARNIYALQMARASYEGFRRANPKKRPFLLTRAGYAGIQRYSAVWTGDNRAEDDHLLMGLRMMMSMGLTGIAFSGMDVGGFVGEASTALYARWMQVGAFTPYMRNHTQINTKSAEPWAFGEEVLEISRNYINLRYRLLPYSYACFYEASQNGLPLMRTLAIDATFEQQVYDPKFENQYLFGPAFMIAPFESQEKYGEVYFPSSDTWYDLYNDLTENGGTSKIIPLYLHKLPVYVKGGSIIPMQSQVQHSGEQTSGILDIHVYEGKHTTTFVYYEDDGDTYDYETNAFYKRSIVFDPTGKQLIIDAVTGDYTSKFNEIRLLLHGFHSVHSIKASLHEPMTHPTSRPAVSNIQLVDEDISFIAPVSNFDPQGTVNPIESCKVKSMVVPNNRGKMAFKFIIKTV